MASPHPPGDRTGERLVAVAALALVLFCPPLLGLLDGGVPVLGVPLPLAWLLGTWAVVVALVARVLRGG